MVTANKALVCTFYDELLPLVQELRKQRKLLKEILDEEE